MAAQVPGSYNGVHYLLKRHVLVLIAFQQCIFYLLQESIEAGIITEIAPYCKGIDEEPDEGFHFLLLSASQRCAYADILLSAVTIEQHLERCQQCHERSYSLLTRKCIHFIRQLPVYTGNEQRTISTLHSGPCMICLQVDWLYERQLF